MIDGATATFTVAFETSGRSRLHHMATLGFVPRVTRHLTRAHTIERRVRAGEFHDLAHASRVFGRARVTQIVALTLLAPAIQAEILALPSVTEGRDPISERTLMLIVAESVWERQLLVWRAPKAVIFSESRSADAPSRRKGDDVALRE